MSVTNQFELLFYVHWLQAGNIDLIWFYAWPHFFVVSFWTLGFFLFFSCLMLSVQKHWFLLLLILKKCPFFKGWEGTGASSSLETWYLFTLLNIVVVSEQTPDIMTTSLGSIPWAFILCRSFKISGDILTSFLHEIDCRWIFLFNEYICDWLLAIF